MRLPIENIQYLLTAHGWNQERQRATTENLLLFSNLQHPGRELALPVSEQAPDYQDAALNLLSKLALIEHSPPEKLIREALIAKAGHLPHSSDSLILRIIKPIEDGEAIPLLLAKSALEESEVLIMSASCQSEKPAKFHRRIHNKISSSLVEKSTFNHTRHGSFVLIVSCPILSAGEQFPLGLDKSNLPFTRKALTSLQESISLLHSAITDNKHIQLIQDTLNTKQPIVSANISESIGNIVAADTGGGVDFGFEWSSLIESPTNINTDINLVFKKENATPLYEIASSLRPKEAVESNRFIGTVEVLRGNLADEGLRAGWIELSILHPTVGWIRAAAELDSSHYKIADQAHINGAQFVAITGTLEPRPRVWIFLSVGNFESIATI